MKKIAIEVAVEIRERRPYILVHERSLPDSTIPKDDNLRVTLRQLLPQQQPLYQRSNIP